MADEWVGHRIKAMRLAKRITLEALYEATGIGDPNHPHSMLQKIETGPPGTPGGRGVSAEEIQKIAEALDTSVEVLLGRAPRRRLVARYGDIGRGGEYFASPSGRWVEIEKLAAPIGDEEVNAVLHVSGKHLEAAGYWDGDLLYFHYPGDPTIDDLIGRRCIIQLRENAQAFVAVLENGSRSGRYRLRYLDGSSPPGDIMIEWAARIRWHQQS